ncbi:MAG: LuxR C-terminal-related transcriptional regulator [Acidimicrobiales bacterium]
MSRDLELGLAATKLQPPTLPASLVRRSSLDDRLDASVNDQVRLVLVSAPAGSGKSTLLASWLARRLEASAWLQVEESDADPVRFWTYLVEAIGQAHSGVSSAVRPVIAASNGDGDVVVSALVTALAEVSEPLIVVLDDYHLIQSETVHRSVERLIELGPPRATFVISTRFDPPFRLSRLRVRKQLIEIRGDDLRFETGEASMLLGMGGQELSRSNIEILSTRTEGWAAGLVLAGFSLDRSADVGQFIEEFGGEDQLIVHYLSDEFLAAISDEDHRRFLALSIAEQFNGALVDALTGSTEGRRWLGDVAATNQLLIGLGRTGEWFRFHHLLRDLLRSEASETMSDQLPELHRRAASWFESKGDERRAIHHWLAAGDQHEAGRLMESYGGQLLVDGQIQTLRRILEDLGDVAQSMGWCTLLWGWCEFIAGRYSAAEEWVDVTHDVAGDGFDQTITAPLRMNISLGRGDVNSALALARELTNPDQLDALAPDQATVAGGVFMWAGQSEEARAVLKVAVETSSHFQIKTPHVLGLIYQAIAEFDAGDTVAARLAAELALDTASELGIAAYYRLGPAYAIRARTGSDDAGALDDASLAIDLVRATTGDLALAYVLTMCGDTLVDLGDPRAEGLLGEARSVVDRCPDPGIAGRYLDRVESRHALVATRPAAAELVEQLTERETAVLRYLPTEMSQREIAAELFVSQNTVKTHCAAIYRKLAVGNRKAAVQAARDLNLL